METAELLLQGAALLVAAAAAGAVNAVAGGGTLLTFPTLIALGLDPLLANATSTVGLVPGALGGAWGYRRELRTVSRWLPWIVPSSVLGGALGALLLVRTPPPLFERLAPLLVLAATVLFVAQEPIARRLRLTRGGAPAGLLQRWIVAAAQVGIATYGGYFGAGMGIVMLAALGLLHLPSIHAMNGLKTFAGGCINGIAAGWFIAAGLVNWPAALTMVAGSLLGGYFGADSARRLGERTVRRMVVAVGLVATVALAARQLG